jgi:hydroxyacylglutathione hydrolase
MTMKKRLIRVLVAACGFIVAVFVVFGALFASAFWGNAPLPDTMDLPGGTRLIKDRMVALFVLPAGGKSVALVDCGNDPTARLIIAELARRGSSPDDVKTIFLTHGHGDHTAGCRAFSKAEVVALEGDTALAAGTEAGHGILTQLHKNSPDKTVKVTHVVHDGETVQVGDLSVRVLAVPGHTSGSAAYLSGGILFLGDSATCRKHGAFAGAPKVFSDDATQNRASLRTLFRRLQDENLAVEVLAPAHSAPQQGLAAFAAFAGSGD